MGTVVEAILKIRGDGKAELEAIASEAGQVEEAIDDAGDASATAAKKTRTWGEALDAAAESAEGAAESAAEIGEAAGKVLAAVVAVGAGFAAIADEVASARLEVAGLAADTGLSLAQVQALQRAADLSGTSFEDLAGTVENLGTDGVDSLVKLSEQIRVVGDVTDEEAVKSALQWKAAISQIKDLVSEATGWIGDVSVKVFDAVAYLAVYVSSIINDLLSQFIDGASYVPRILKDLVTGNAADFSQAGADLGFDPFESIRRAGTTADTTTAAMFADRQQRAKLGGAALVTLEASGAQAKAQAAATEAEAAATKTKQEGEKATQEAKKAEQELTAARKEAARVAADKAAADAAFARGMDEYRRTTEDAALSVAALADVTARWRKQLQDDEAMIGLAPDPGRDARVAANLAAIDAADAPLIRAQRAARLQGQVSGGIAAASMGMSGDISGLLALAGPGGAAAGAAVSLLQELGTQGADKIVQQIRDSVGGLVAGVQEIPDLLVGLAEALPDLLVELAGAIPAMLPELLKAIVIDLPLALWRGFGELLKGAVRDLAEALNPFDGDGARGGSWARVIPRGTSAGVGAAQAFNLLSDLGMFRRGQGRDRRGAPSRAATSASRRATVLHEPLESRLLRARQAGHDSLLVRSYD